MPVIVLDGGSMLGKTTLMNMLGWLYERQHGSAEGVAPGCDYCPVVNVVLESDATVTSINESVLRFLGAPLPPRGRQRDLNQPAKQAVRAAGVRLVIVDELNYLKKRYVKHQVVNDHLKWLVNSLPVTFAFIATDWASTSLMASEQTSWRVKRWQLRPFSVDDSDGRREWQQLLVDIERQLVLLDAPERMLSRDAAVRAYLHRRSGGRIGALLDLVRSATEEAMTNERETIDMELLKTIDAVFGAQAAYLEAA